MDKNQINEINDRFNEMRVQIHEQLDKELDKKLYDTKTKLEALKHDAIISLNVKVDDIKDEVANTQSKASSFLRSLHKIQESINPDLVLHFSVSFVIIAVLHLLVGLPDILAILVTLLIGVAKEKFVDTEFSYHDLMADCLGILMYLACISKYMSY